MKLTKEQKGKIKSVYDSRRDKYVAAAIAKHFSPKVEVADPIPQLFLKMEKLIIEGYRVDLHGSRSVYGAPTSIASFIKPDNVQSLERAAITEQAEKALVDEITTYLTTCWKEEQAEQAAVEAKQKTAAAQIKEKTIEDEIRQILGE